MCCFSGKVQSVSETNIFARRKDSKSQYLVYSMSLLTKDDVAMILPLPTPRNSPEDAVTFINLEEYETFFRDMARGWPPPPASRSRSNTETAVDSLKLEVVEVGSFEASFVPKIADFTRLDARFRLPTNVWESLPAYRESGFAVFKLKKGNHRVHPMAFSFPTRSAEKLFFPTVHIHDGKVHRRAKFDHTLYCQEQSSVPFTAPRWSESHWIATQFMDLKKSQGLVEGESHVYKIDLHGTMKNEDVWV